MAVQKSTGRRIVPVKFLLPSILCVLLLLAGLICLFAGKGSKTPAGTYHADIAVRDYGTITVALDGDAAPKTVENFVSLAQSGFYDGLTFHRIIEGFMMQGGDPNGDGTGGSGTTIPGEFSENGSDNDLSHTRGAISMARSQDYDSASSQFFIVQEDSTYLDGSYAVFGYVTDGMDVVDRICADAQPIDNNGTIAADAQPVISSITVYE
ncbi:MAG: peptidylprolyl isomerase [Oscillospiraceae bacterium]